MFNRILEQVKIFRMFIPLYDFEILYCSFIKYVLYFRKISLLLKKSSHFIANTPLGYVYNKLRVLVWPLPFQRTSLTIIPSFFYL